MADVETQPPIKAGGGLGSLDAMQTLVGCVIVAAMWGATNPFLVRGAQPPKEADLWYKTGIARTIEVVVRVLLNWRFSIPFGINQLGSVANNVLLGFAPISIVGPICNALTFVFTALAARLVGEKQPITWQTVAGTLLIMGGLALCVYSSAAREQEP